MVRTSILLVLGAAVASCVVSFPDDFREADGSGGSGGDTSSTSTSSTSTSSTSTSSTSTSSTSTSSTSTSSTSTSSTSAWPCIADGEQNGNETDLDCGGSCPPCAPNRSCNVDSDCVGRACVAGKCAATCTDGTTNGNETDVDCGGQDCPKCAGTKSCGTDADCGSGKCSVGACLDALLISEVQTRGTNGALDEFVEIYNATNSAIAFDATWEVWARGASSPCAPLQPRFAGAGQIIPAFGHLLYAAAGYDGTMAPDATYAAGLGDSGQIVLLRAGAAVDLLCYSFDAATFANLICPHEPELLCPSAVTNNPHYDGDAMDDDLSMERKPGGGAGNSQNSGSPGIDFSAPVPSNPQNLASTPTP